MNPFVRFLENLRKDVQLAVRNFSRSPGFTIVAVLSITLGIGANTAIFSLIDAVMLRMLPVKDPEGLQLVVHGQGSSFQTGFTFSQYRLMRDQNKVLTALAAYSPVRLNVTLSGGIEPTADGLLVSGSYFSVLGVSPIIGRAILPEDDRVPNGHRVAMISHGYWRRRFAQSPDILSRTITLSGTPFSIIGVTPPEFFGIEVGTAPDIFVPVMMQPTVDPSTENLLQNPIIYSSWLRAFGRLKPEVGQAQAVSDLEVLFRQEMPKPGGGKFGGLEKEMLRLQPAATGLSDLRRQFSQPLFILMAIVVMVLLIACANTANLLLARAASRQAEFAMRFSLGGTRQRIIGQLLVESVVLAVLGGLCGILLARWATKLLVIYISSGRNPVVLDLNPDMRVLAFTAAVSIGTGILFGLVPAIRATRIDLAGALKSLGGSQTRGRSRLRPGRTLAIIQIALSLMLLAGAGVFVRGLQEMNGGTESQDSVLIVRVEPKGSDQRNIPGSYPRLDRIYKELLQRVEAIHGVRSASLAQFTPTNRRGLTPSVAMPSGEQKQVFMPMVYGNYFRTMGIPIIAGRDFAPSDLVENASPVVVVSESFARQAYPNENAVGKPCLVSNRARVPCQIIGVVKDSRYANLRAEPPATAYSPYLQTPTGRGQMALHVRVAGGVEPVLRRVREEVQSVDKDLPMFEIHTLAQEIDAALIQERLMATLSSCFSTLALLLAGVGLYGLLAFTVVQRTGEVGIRMALGATRGQVLWMVLREALLLTIAGVAIGIPVAFAAAKLVSSQITGLFFGLKATDPAPIAAATLILAAVAVLAGYLPARRASRVDPMVALRNE